jgi:glycosyltransferase involved in cell wall biosynthesis
MARIIHVCPRYLPARGGSELFFAKLSEHLVTLGHALSVWTTDALTVRAFTRPSGRAQVPDFETVNGVEVRRFPVRHLPAQRLVRTAGHYLPFGTRWKCDTLRWTPWVPSLTREAARHRGTVDLVHVSGLPYSSVLYAGVRLADRTAARLIVSPFTHVAPPGPRGDRMRRAYLSPLNLGLIARADKVFVQTALEHRVLAEAGISPDRLVTIGLGVDPQDCTGGSRVRGRRTWGVPPDAVVVGHLANKSWDKGTIDLLDAAERLWDRGSPFMLVLAGSEMPSFSERWARVRFRERIVNLGELSDDERRDFFAAIDVFVLPSYVESFGLTPLEAALNHVAIVAYDHGGPGQLFAHQSDALLAPAGDTKSLSHLIDTLVTDQANRMRLAQAAAEVPRRLSWQKVLQNVAAEYQLLLQPKPLGMPTVA